MQKGYKDLKGYFQEEDGNRYLEDPDRKKVKFLTFYIECM